MDISNIAAQMIAQGMTNAKNLNPDNLHKFAVPSEIIKDNAKLNQLISKLESMVVLSDILGQAGLKPTKENLQLVDTLLESGLPVTKDNLQKLNQAAKAMGTDPQRAVFFLKNDIRPSSINIETIKNYINHDTNLSNQLTALLEAIDELPDEATKARLYQVLNEVGNLPKGDSASAAVLQGKITEAMPKITEQMASHHAQNPLNTIPEKLDKLISIIKELLPPEQQMKPDTEILKALASMLQSDDNELFTKLFQPKSDEEFSQLKKAIESKLISEGNQSELGEDLFDENILTRNEHNLKNEQSALIEQNNITQKNKSTRDEILQKLFIKLDENTVEDVDKLLNKINEKMTQIKEIVSQAGQDGAKIAKATDDINNNLRFINNLRDSVYVQIPVIINDNKTNSELYVFKNKQNKNKEKKVKSALLALDLPALGHLETYIQRTDSAINCQFKIRDKSIETLISSNINKLSTYIKSLNLDLTGYSIKLSDESFDLLEPEPEIIGVSEHINTRNDYKKGFDFTM